MTGPIEAAVTDLDGTLVGTETANLLAYADAFADAGVTFDPAAYRAAFGLRFRELLDRIAPGTPADVADRIAAAKADRYPQHFDRLVVNDGLVAVLTAFKTAGLPVGLATTAAGRNATAILEHTGLAALFDQIVVGEDVTAGKPDPECYLTLSHRLGVVPGRTIAFEDTSIGVEAARSAGHPVVRVRIDEHTSPAPSLNGDSSTDPVREELRGGS